jgi:hypothetical protein
LLTGARRCSQCRFSSKALLRLSEAAEGPKLKAFGADVALPESELPVGARTPKHALPGAFCARFYPRRMASDEFVNVHARAWSDLAQDEPLRFPAPVIEGVPEHVAEFWWRQVQYAFPSDDPREFPPLGRDAFDAGQLEVLDRFAAAAGALAGSIVLNGEWKLTIDLAQDGAESVNSAFPDDENLRGFSVLFRQFYSAEEVASFHSAQKVLNTVSAAIDGQDHDRRLEMLKVWRSAHGKMQAEQSEMLVLRALVDNKRIPEGALELHREVPNKLISIYNYGER